MENNAGAHEQEEVATGGASRRPPSSAGQLEDGKQEGLREGLRSFDRIKGILDTLVSIAAIVGIILVYQQLEAMKETNFLTQESLRMTRESNADADQVTERTLKLMEESNLLTRKALDESKRQAEASRLQTALDAEASRAQIAEDAESLRRQISLEAEAMRAQNETQITATLKMASENLKESRRFFEVSQRAQLVVESIDFTYTKGRRVPVGGRVKVRNAGSLVATNVRWEVCLAGDAPSAQYLSALIHPIPIEGALPEMQDSIGPGAIRELPVKRGRWGYACPKEFPLEATSSVAYLLIRVQYLDGFGRERYFDACRFWTIASEVEQGFFEAPCMHFAGEGLVEDLRLKDPSAE